VPVSRVKPLLDVRVHAVIVCSHDPQAIVWQHAAVKHSLAALDQPRGQIDCD
jgi:hypothetical protein